MDAPSVTVLWTSANLLVLAATFRIVGWCWRNEVVASAATLVGCAGLGMLEGLVLYLLIKG